MMRGHNFLTALVIFAVIGILINKVMEFRYFKIKFQNVERLV
jgi:hypothetical protein